METDKAIKTNQHTFAINSIMLAGTLLFGNEALSIMSKSISDSIVYPVAASCVVGGFLLDQLFSESKYEKLFRLCGIENKDKKVPLVIKNDHKDKIRTLVIHLPEGLSQKHFEAKQQELEQFLNAKIEFGFNKNLVIKLTEMNLKTMYPFLFEQCEKPLEIYCGETHAGKFILDIEKCPHVIVAGETNGGKTSLLDIMVLSLMMNKFDLDLHLIDFQAVGLGIFENCKKVRSYGETPNDFERLMDEMEQENDRRLKLFRSVKNKIYINKLSTWNEHFPKKALPYKVVVVDEFARMAEDQYKPVLERFRSRASMDRKVGIHYIICLQRPDVKCIEGSIKANMPTRIAFKTVTETDSKVILDQPGAEKLKNAGRFLAKYCGELTEVQSMYIASENVRKVLKKYNLYKSREELEAQRREEIKARREKCINPYLKGGSA